MNSQLSSDVYLIRKAYEKVSEHLYLASLHEEIGSSNKKKSTFETLEAINTTLTEFEKIFYKQSPPHQTSELSIQHTQQDIKQILMPNKYCYLQQQDISLSSVNPTNKSYRNKPIRIADQIKKLINEELTFDAIKQRLKISNRVLQKQLRMMHRKMLPNQQLSQNMKTQILENIKNEVQPGQMLSMNLIKRKIEQVSQNKCLKVDYSLVKKFIKESQLYQQYFISDKKNE